MLEQSKLDLSSKVGRVPQAVGRAVRPAEKQEHGSLVFSPFSVPVPSVASASPGDALPPAHDGPVVLGRAPGLALTRCHSRRYEAPVALPGLRVDAPPACIVDSGPLPSLSMLEQALNVRVKYGAHVKMRTTRSMCHSGSDQAGPPGV